MNIKTEDKKFRCDWEVDFANLIVHRKNFGFLRRLREKIWKTKYPVISLYRFARESEATPHAMSYPHIVNSDNLQPIEDIPTRFELNNGWDIPEQDRKHLVFGPLTKADKIIVPALPERIFLISVWEYIKFLSILGGAVFFLIWIIQNILKLFT